MDTAKRRIFIDENKIQLKSAPAIYILKKTEECAHVMAVTK